MTDEERKEQTKKVYALKMWEQAEIKIPNYYDNEEYNIVWFTRVPGGWLVTGAEDGAMCFVPMHKESEHVCTCNQSKNIKI